MKPLFYFLIGGGVAGLVFSVGTVWLFAKLMKPAVEAAQAAAKAGSQPVHPMVIALVLRDADVTGKQPLVITINGVDKTTAIIPSNRPGFVHVVATMDSGEVKTQYAEIALTSRVPDKFVEPVGVVH